MEQVGFPDPRNPQRTVTRSLAEALMRDARLCTFAAGGLSACVGAATEIADVSDDEKDSSKSGDDGGGWNVQGHFSGLADLHAGAAVIDAGGGLVRRFGFGQGRA